MGEIQEVFALTDFHESDQYKIYTDNNNKKELLLTSLALTATSETFTEQPDVVCQAIERLQELGHLTEERANGILRCQYGKKVNIVCGSCGTLGKIPLQGCNSRICPFCNVKRRKKAYARMQRVFATFTRLRFLTIGFKNVPELTREYLRSCKDTYRKFKAILRRKGYDFGSTVNVPEYKLHEQGEPRFDSDTKQQIGTYGMREWNVHYHILFDGTYIGFDVLRDAMLRASKGETRYLYIKDANRTPVGYPRAALSYILKYVGKAEGMHNSPETLVEYYLATKGLRAFDSWITKDQRQNIPAPMKLTCVTCDSQFFYTPWNTPWELFQGLLEGRAPEEDAFKMHPKKEPPEDPEPLVEEIPQSSEILVQNIPLQVLLERGDVYEPRPGKYELVNHGV